jgi:hypothetical protein
MGPGWLGSREEGMTMFKPGNQDQPPKKKQGVSYEYVNDYVEDGTFDADLGSHLLMLVRQKAKNQYKPNHLQQLYEAGGYIGQDGKRHMSSTPTWSGNAGYEMGGPIVGDEMEVTPEQLEQLRAQGYQFEII